MPIDSAGPEAISSRAGITGDVMKSNSNNQNKNGNEGINILVTLNSNYLKPLRVMLFSLFKNNKGEDITIYVVHTSLKEAEIAALDKFVAALGGRLESIRVPEDFFGDAPVLLHYTKEMYFRLLAHKLLPEDLNKILYLDPDILVLNPLRELYDTDISDYLYGAADHDLLTVKEINKVRLFPYEIEFYYNSGVLLMNLEGQRREVSETEIFEFVEENRNLLIMPDQDILNALYAKRIKPLDETLYNYDVRYYTTYKLKSNGVVNMDYIIRNTAILHFCGKKKPWNKGYSGKFYSLYKHYEKKAEDFTEELAL